MKRMKRQRIAITTAILCGASVACLEPSAEEYCPTVDENACATEESVEDCRAAYDFCGGAGNLVVSRSCPPQYDCANDYRNGSE